VEVKGSFGPLKGHVTAIAFSEMKKGRDLTRSCHSGRKCPDIVL
jgi:hypothetical protein